MKIYYSYLCKIGISFPESIDQMIRFGGDHIELMLDGDSWNEFEKHSNRLVSMLSAQNAVYSVHTPVWDMNLTSENAQARHAALEAYQNSIAFASAVGAEHVVLHPGFCYAPVFDKMIARQRAKEAIEALCEWNEKYGELLLVENVGNPGTSIFTQEEYVTFICNFNGAVGSLLDIGHAHLCGWDLPEVIAGLKRHLFAVHLHDNDGKSDSHLPMGDGTVPWPAVFQALQDCNPELRLILEYDIGTPLRMLQMGKEVLLHTFQPVEKIL